MSDPTPIGDLIGPIIKRALWLARYRSQLELMQGPPYRKRHITLLYEAGLLSPDEVALLVETLKLEAA